MIVYHTVQDLVSMKDQNEGIDTKLYSIRKFEVPEQKTWEGVYNEVQQYIVDLNQTEGIFVATATSSD